MVQKIMSIYCIHVYCFYLLTSVVILFSVRLLLSFPQTKTYFTRFDQTPGSTDLNTHGGKIINALASAANHLDDIAGNLSSLSDLHAINLHNRFGIPLLSRTIQVVLATHFPGDFTADVKVAWDKFLALDSAVLTSKYR
ncbi:hemoglobin subunit alpha-3-like [Rana temporaria]|uniref:hemoglobin subunit alpha-3-like n=1 Tax=Rana temporaria TaxID=8407 RepID=UPI001AADA899|nr:hemoglobin subunit alpha-3-like [Rana temporaria]